MTISLLSVGSLLEDVFSGAGTYTVVDARPSKELENGHIPHAVPVSWEDFCANPPSGCKRILREPGYWGALGDPVGARFGDRLALAGISQDKPVVVYADSARSRGREGRIAWMLLYLGATEVFILNGGWSGWLAADGPTASGSWCSTGNGQFCLNLDERRRVKLDALLKLHGSDEMPVMIDTRTAAEFAGDCYDYQPRKGRLPRSILFPFDLLFESDDTFVSRERYLELAGADLLAARRKVAYCEVGVRASTFALLHEIYTGEILPVYDGSIMEWGWHVNLPVVA